MGLTETSRNDREQVPGLRNPLELVLAAILELNSRTGDKVLDRGRHEHLSGLGEGRDARAYVDSDAPRLAVDQLALAAVQPRADLQVEVADGLSDREGTADRPCRAVEGGEEAVASGVHFLTAETTELRADGLVMLLQYSAPGAVAQLDRPRGGADDVREENGREDSVRLGLPRLPCGDLCKEAFQLGQERFGIADRRAKSRPPSSTRRAPGMCSAK